MTLQTAGNNFGTVSLVGGAANLGVVAVSDTVDAMSIGGNATTLTANASGQLTLTGGTYTTLNAASGNGIIQSGALVVSGTTTLTSDAAGKDVTLQTAGNNFGTVSLVGGAANLGVVAVSDTVDAMSIGGNATTLTANASGQLTLTGGTYTTLNAASGNGIIQSGALVVSGTTTLTSDAAGKDVTLQTAGNNFGTVSLVGGAANLGVVAVSDTVDAMSIGGNATTLTANASGQLTLTGGTYTTLNAASGNGIIQSGALVVSGTTTLTSDAAGKDVTLQTAGNNFGTVSLVGGAANLGVVAVSDTVDAMSIGGNATTLTANASGQLTLTGGTYTTLNAASGNGIIQSGALVVSGTTTLTSDAAGKDVTLQTAGNNFGTVSLVGGAANLGVVAVSDTVDAMSIGGNATTLTANASGQLTLTGGTYTTLNAASGNGIIQSGALVVSGTTTLTSDAAGKDVTLQTAGNNFGTVSLVGGAANLGVVAVSDTVDAMSIGGNATTLTANASGQLTLTGGTYTTLNAASGNGIIQSGALVVSGTTTLTSDAAGKDVTLQTAGNNFGTVSLVGGAANLGVVAVE
ncbi:MAG: hypothetical protein IPK29_07230 [Betaproteobacteria bacterium]|nr:hypothetical protein [Betaproteobacteria bacterium]